MGWRCAPVALSLAAVLVSGCGSRSAPREASGRPSLPMSASQSVIASPTTETSPPAAVGDAPQTIVLAPLDAQGNFQPGWQAPSEDPTQTIDCTTGLASPYDVGTGVRWCGATADSGDACWHLPEGYVSCLVDPFNRTMKDWIADGWETPLKPRDEQAHPMALLLDDGSRCRAVIGGSWGLRGGPNYWCPTDAGGLGIYGSSPSSWHGIDKGPDGWVVHLGSPDDPKTPLVPKKVKTAYFVGVA